MNPVCLQAIDELCDSRYRISRITAHERHESGESPFGLRLDREHDAYTAEDGSANFRLWPGEGRDDGGWKEGGSHAWEAHYALTLTQSPV